MISIIICSRFQSISKELKDNIENTVGVVMRLYVLITVKVNMIYLVLITKGSKGANIHFYVLCMKIFYITLVIGESF